MKRIQHQRETSTMIAKKKTVLLFGTIMFLFLIALIFKTSKSTLPSEKVSVYYKKNSYL
jgi:hypothetical protein